MTFRDPRMDLLKEGIAQRTARKTRCSQEGCNNFLTPYQGPGSDTLCRDHQKNLAEYGGLATIKKEYSQHRDTHCSHCGYTPLTDPRVQEIEDLKVRNRLVRTLLTVDHMDGNHSNNSPENLQTLCPNCHAIKTVINGDTMTPSNQNV
tara:strand:- start:1748 stop:2191 length:444 start_codon:yes stop_codon:yes gene_type:complete